LSWQLRSPGFLNQGISAGNILNLYNVPTIKLDVFFRNICPRKMTFNPQGCFDYVTYIDLKADKGSMQHFQPPNEKV